MDPAHRYSKFRSGPVLVVVLDSTHVVDPAFNQAQLAFLDDALAEDVPWKLVLFHHAVYSESFAHGFLGRFTASQHLTLRSDYEPIFKRRGVDLVVAGHVHLLERSSKEGVAYLVGGPAGGTMGIRSVENPYSQLSMEVRSATSFIATPDTLTLDSYDHEGTALDHFVLQKRPAQTPE